MVAAASLLVLCDFVKQFAHSRTSLLLSFSHLDRQSLILLSHLVEFAAELVADVDVARFLVVVDLLRLVHLVLALFELFFEREARVAGLVLTLELRLQPFPHLFALLDRIEKALS